MNDTLQILQYVKDAPLVVVFIGGVYLGRKWVLDQYNALINEKIRSLEKDLDEIKSQLANLHNDLNEINKTVSGFEGHLRASKEFKSGVI